MGHGVLRRTENLGFQLDQARRRIEQLERRYRFPIGYYEIKCFADRNALDGNLDDAAIVVSVGDGKFLFPIPKSLNNTYLSDAEIGISVAGSSDVEVMIGYCGTDPTTFPGTDMLTAPITIATGDFVSFTPGATDDNPDIDTSIGNVSSGDWISINVLDDGGGVAEGMVVMLQFFF